MSVAEAAATAEVQEPGGRLRSSSPRHIPVVGVVTEDEEAQVWAVSVLWEAWRGGGDLGGGDEASGQQEWKWEPEWKLYEPAGLRYQALS